MKFCISGRQPYSVLKRADEVKVMYPDRDRILDFIENIPDKTIILDVPDVEADFKVWHMYDERFEAFYVALHNLARAEEFNGEGIKWYWPYPVTSFYELQSIIQLRPSYVMIGAPLSFDLEAVAQVVEDIPVRMVANVAKPQYLITNHQDYNITGQWIRPEDVDAYSEYVTTLEFDGVSNNLQKEEALLRVYKEAKMWLGNLNLLIDEFNYNVDNRAIPEGLVKARMNCGQRCMKDGICHRCYNSIILANRLRQYKRSTTLTEES